VAFSDCRAVASYLPDREAVCSMKSWSFFLILDNFSVSFFLFTGKEEGSILLASGMELAE
jgi:hypothetical protein